jgi:hypothetical protein
MNVFRILLGMALVASVVIGVLAPRVTVDLGQPAAAQGYEDAIYDACARYGCDGGQLVRVMYCESGGDPGAVNPVTGDYGLFQINLNIWGPITDPYAQIEFAAQKFAAGQGYLWVCN